MSAYALKLNLVVYWVPVPSGIRGNEIADQNATVAALRNVVDIPHVFYLYMKALVRSRLRRRLQQQWDTQINKLNIIKP